MKKLILVFAIVVFMLGCSNEPENKTKTVNKIETKEKVLEWFEGGSLHNSTIEEWKQARYENKLATSADWIITVSEPIKSVVRQSGDVNVLKPYATELVVCIDESSKDDVEFIEAQSSADISILCMKLMEYL